MRGRLGAAEIEAARPFDRERNGFILGEGAFLILAESFSSAAARGARVYGEILGIGATSSPTSANDWPGDGGGLARAMRLALADAAVPPDDIAAIIGTANGSPVLDRHEADAIVDVFGDRAAPVCSIKGAIGEFGAAAAAGIVAGLESLSTGMVPPTAGFACRDAAIPVSVCNHPQPARGDTFVVNSVASGGTNYSVVVQAASGRA
jgi:3-oxoacyl-(acyl-carrier-protein) synthase